MRTYKLNLKAGMPDALEVLELREGDAATYWRHVGDLDRWDVARRILLDITRQQGLVVEYADRFARHFINPRESFPRIITERDVLDWISKQTSGL